MGAEESSSNFPSTIKNLGGINERAAFSNSEGGEWDVVIGMYTERNGALTQIPGQKFLLNVGEPIRSICQTHDLRGNVIIETDSNTYIISDEELFGRTIPSNLTPTDQLLEEEMSRAIIAHVANTNVNAGGVTTSLSARPLTDIIEQLNPDGTAATFVTSIANPQFTITDGVYRFRGWAVAAAAAGGARAICQLYNVTAAAPAWNGLFNECSQSAQAPGADQNHLIHFGGQLTLAVPTTFELRQAASAAYASKGLGVAMNLLSKKEVYAWIEIFKCQ